MAFSGAHLATARLTAGLTQEQLARALDTEQTRVSEWERGAKTPRPEVIPKLAAAVGLDALGFLAAGPGAASVEDLRLAVGQTPQQIASSLGVSLRRYRGVENGSTRRDPPDEVVQRLAELFGTSVALVLQAIEVARR